ncbi:MAG TPA: biotin/lipoyl-binding protein, partial [Blastocatellia bacterium]|nr:biotin/lipoyl-binding protein [Blastocatellia bacterium]
MARVIDEINEVNTAEVDERYEDVPAIADDELEAMMREGNEPPRDKKDEPKDKKRATPIYKRARVMLIAAIVLIVGLTFGVRHFVYASAHETTDDAFVEGHIIQISPKVTGHIAKVYVTDNRHVKKGDLLAEIDSRDYEARLAQAKATELSAQSKAQAASLNVNVTSTTAGAGVAQASSGVQTAKSNVENARAAVEATRGRLEQAQAQVKTAQANAESARAQVTAAEAEATRANADAQRYSELYKQDVISRQQYDNAVAAART